MIHINNTAAEEAENSASGFGRYAAWLGMMLPLFIYALVGGYAYWFRLHPPQPEQLMAASMVIGTGAVIFMAIGLSCAIISFFGHGEDRPNGLVMLGVLGLVLNTLPFLLGVGSIQKASARSWGGFQTAVTEVKSDIKQDIEADGTATYTPEHAAKLNTSLDQVSATGNPQDAKLAQALKGFISEIDQAAQTLQQEVELIQKLSPMNPLLLKTRADLQIRKSTVASFLKHNEEIRETLAHPLPRIQEHLATAGVPRKIASKAETDFQTNFKPRQEFLIAMGECDHRIASAMAAAVEIYDQNWQQWRKDEHGEFAGLEDHTATEEIYRLMGIIQTAAAEQEELRSAYKKTL